MRFQLATLSVMVAVATAKTVVRGRSLQNAELGPNAPLNQPRDIPYSAPTPVRRDVNHDDPNDPTHTHAPGEAADEEAEISARAFYVSSAGEHAGQDSNADEAAEDSEIAARAFYVSSAGEHAGQDSNTDEAAEEDSEISARAFYVSSAGEHAGQDSNTDEAAEEDSEISARAFYVSSAGEHAGQDSEDAEHEDSEPQRRWVAPRHEGHSDGDGHDGHDMASMPGMKMGNATSSTSTSPTAGAGVVRQSWIGTAAVAGGVALLLAAM